MGAYNAAGTRYTTGTFPKTAYTPADALFTLTADVYADRVLAGEEANFKNPTGQSDPSGRVLWRKSGQVVKQSEIDALFPAGTLTSISPATGVAAGGTAITINGTNLTGVTALTLGGVAVTSLVVVNSKRLTAVTGAHSAGAVTAIATDDAGTITQTGLFTYT